MPGVTFNNNEFILIQFQKPQAVDSIVILSDSNVALYSVTYTKVEDDEEYVLQEVRDDDIFCRVCCKTNDYWQDQAIAETKFNGLQTRRIRISPRTKQNNNLTYRIRLAVYVCGELTTVIPQGNIRFYRKSRSSTTLYF